MSEFSFESRAVESRPEILPDSAMGEGCQSVPMPFEADSEEADALRGALGFLFALITTYDEMIEAATSETDAGASGQSLL